MESPAEFTGCLELQRAAHLADPVPTLRSRRAVLDALHRMLKENEAGILAAIDADFGGRSPVETRMLELFAVREGIRRTRGRLRGWMRPQRRSIDRLAYPGAGNRVIPQPLGVVGVIVPWNFPIQLSFGPLIDILAAGNRAMVKISENSARRSRLLVEIGPRYFPVETLAFFSPAAGGALRS